METTMKDGTPIILTTTDVKELLGCGRRQAYELMRSASFPSFKIGGRLCIRKDRFYEWMDDQVRILHADQPHQTSGITLMD